MALVQFPALDDRQPGAVHLIEDVVQRVDGPFEIRGMAADSQFMGTDGTIVDIADTAIDAETINSTADVSVIRASDNSEYADAALVGQVVTAE